MEHNNYMQSTLTEQDNSGQNEQMEQDNYVGIGYMEQTGIYKEYSWSVTTLVLKYTVFSAWKPHTHTYICLYVRYVSQYDQPPPSSFFQPSTAVDKTHQRKYTITVCYTCILMN